MIPFTPPPNSLHPESPRRGRRRHTSHNTAASTAAPSAPTEDDMDLLGYETALGYESGLTYDHPPLPQMEHMSPERKARKQRMRPEARRRGGASHSDLLKSAVLATLEAEDESNNMGGGRRRQSLNAFTQSTPLALDNDSQRNNPRKRARQQNMDCQEDDQDEEFLDDCLLGAMDFCTISTTAQQRRQASQPNCKPHQHYPSTPLPVRHVARRTSKELACGIVPSPRTSSCGESI